MRRGEKSPDDLDRPRGNDLETNYEKHDIGHAEFVKRIEDAGFVVEDWGIDMRDDDGEGGIIYDDKLDFKVYKDGELVGLVDVKTKSGPSYMGRFNDRHYVKYHDKMEEHGVPTYVVMFQVDYQTTEVHDEFVFRITGELYDGVQPSHSSDAVDSFPDGNEAVLVEHDRRWNWGDLVAQLNMEVV